MEINGKINSKNSITGNTSNTIGIDGYIKINDYLNGNLSDNNKINANIKNKGNLNGNITSNHIDGNIVNTNSVNGVINLGGNGQPLDASINNIKIEGHKTSEEYLIKTHYTDIVGSDVEIGDIKLGEKFENIEVIDLLYKILHKYNQPIITIGIKPTNTLYNCVDDKIETLKITADVTKRTKPIKWVKIYFNDELWETIDGEIVAEGGLFSVEKNFETPITGKSGEFYKCRVECNDDTKTPYAETYIRFVGNSYIGVLEEHVEINETNIKSLKTNLKNTKTIDYTFNTEGSNLYNIVYAYPKHLGNLTSIKDKLQFENIQEYTLSFIKIDNIDYNLYVINNPISVTDYVLNFR